MIKIHVFSLVILSQVLIIFALQSPLLSTPWGASSGIAYNRKFEKKRHFKPEHDGLRKLFTPTSHLINPERRRNRYQKTLATALQGADNDSSFSRFIQNNEPVKIIIAGAPASGKGTQCELIKAQYGVVHLSTGDMLRAAVLDKTEIGILAKAYMDSGKLVPDEIMIGVVKDRLQQADCLSQGWLLDGFPRTQAQAEALADAGVCPDCFLFLKVPEDILLERVVGRRTDPDTGKIYHLTFSPPPAELINRLVHRTDDTEEKIKVRLEQFNANVEAVQDSYTDISVTIDGSQTPDKVARDIFDAIEEKLGQRNVVAA